MQRGSRFALFSVSSCGDNLNFVHAWWWPLFTAAWWPEQRTCVAWLTFKQVSASIYVCDKWHQVTVGLLVQLNGSRLILEAIDSEPMQNYSVLD